MKFSKEIKNKKIFSRSHCVCIFVLHSRKNSHFHLVVIETPWLRMSEIYFMIEYLARIMMNNPLKLFACSLFSQLNIISRALWFYCWLFSSMKEFQCSPAIISGASTKHIKTRKWQSPYLGVKAKRMTSTENWFSICTIEKKRKIIHSLSLNIQQLPVYFKF